MQPGEGWKLSGVVDKKDYGKTWSSRQGIFRQCYTMENGDGQL